MYMNKIRQKFEDTTRSRSIHPQSTSQEAGAIGISPATLRRVTGLIELSTLIINSLIGLRFLLKLLAANPDNTFAQLVYFFTAPFLAIFVGLTRTPSFEGIVIEFYDLIAILVYFIFSWALIQLIWILFARIKQP
jgi:YggT family protein